MSVPYTIDRIEDHDGCHVATNVWVEGDAVLSFLGPGMHACFYLNVEPDHTLLIDGKWPEALNVAAIDRRGCELIGHPVFAPGTVAGDAIVVDARNAYVLVNEYFYDDSWRNTQVLVFDRPVVPLPSR